MSTRSNIALMRNDGSCQMIYCHCDGYLEHMGSALTESYDTVERVGKLIAMGDASAIYSTLVTSKFYHRNYNEDWDDVKPTELEDLDQLLKVARQEYLYLFREDTGKWYVSCSYTKRDLEELDVVLKAKPWEDD